LGEAFLALEAAGWKAGSALACDAATADLWRQALRGAAARGRLNRLALHLDGPHCHAGQLHRAAHRLRSKPRLTRILPAFRPACCCSAKIWRCCSAPASRPAILRGGGPPHDRSSVARAAPVGSSSIALAVWRGARCSGPVAAGNRALAHPFLCRRAAMSLPRASRAIFASAYPETPHKLIHTLDEHPLLELEALATLAETLPEASVEYNKADLPIGTDGKPEASGIPVGETIRRIEKSGSWAALKNIEQVPAYAALLHELLEELRPEIEARTGKMLKMQGFIFITSPNGVTPITSTRTQHPAASGSKVMTQFPPTTPSTPRWRCTRPITPAAGAS
jgi:hypothetical protein